MCLLNVVDGILIALHILVIDIPLLYKDKASSFLMSNK
jgi:hypothetical protein